MRILPLSEASQYLIHMPVKPIVVRQDDLPRCHYGHLKCDGSDCEPGGRPTKWTPELNDRLIEYFGTEDRYEDRLTMEIHKKSGDVVEKYERFPKPLPYVSRFEYNNGLSVGLLSIWAAEEQKLLEEGLPSKRPGFLKAYACAKEFQKEFLIQNSLSGLYNPQFAVFTAKNITDMRDKTQQELSGPNGEALKVNVITYGSGDPLLKALAAPSTYADVPAPVDSSPSSDVVHAASSPLQSGSVASQGVEDVDVRERAPTVGGDSDGDVLVCRALLESSKEDCVGGSADAPEVLPAGDLGQSE